TPTSTPAEQPQYGGTLRLHQYRDIVSYDISRVSSIYDGPMVLDKLFTNLLWWNPGPLQLECDACTSWEVSQDGTVFTFNLVRGIQFHDGGELTARDVAYSLNKHMGRVDGVSSPRVGALDSYVDRIETPDDYTVVLRLHSPSPVAAWFVAIPYAGIFPEGTTSDELAEKPMGSGPFILDSYTRGSSMLVLKNPGYFKEGLPYVDAAEHIIIKDSAAMQSAFLIGRVDVIRTTFTPDFLPLMRKKVEEGKVVIQYVPGSQYGLLFGAADSPFLDRRVRQAVFLAYDRAAENQMLYDGEGQLALFLPAQETVPWGRPMSELAQYPGLRQPKDQDITEAKRLISEAGYPDGFDVTMTVRNKSPVPHWSEVVVAQLATLGINARMELTEDAFLYPILESGDFAIAPFTAGEVVPDPDMLIGKYAEGHPRNYTYLRGQGDPELETLLEQVSREMDPVRRQQLVREAEDRLLWELPVIPTVMPLMHMSHWAYVRNWNPTYTGRQSEYRHETTWLVPR
ncbi:ABC transporter substrate-binding protein, partial [Chloroflexota bacterium]